MNNLKKTKGITENLKNFLNIDVDHIQSEDINKILNLPLPIKQIDNLLKITNHTNENLQTLKDNLLKNRNLIAEEISCLNEVFVNCQSSLHEIEEENVFRGLRGDYVKEIENNETDDEESVENDEEMNDESPIKIIKSSEADDEARQLLKKIKKNRSESLGSPPKLDLAKLNS